MRRRLAPALAVSFALLFATAAVCAQGPGGLRAGATAPSFDLKDQSGQKQTLATLTGPNGLLVLFFRSADWCPFCKGQLVDLESVQKAFVLKGVNVAAISYDSPAILQDFAKRRGITYPLLSDSHSTVIDAFGIRNPAGTGAEAGIPYPGYYLLTKDGTIKERFFENAYVNRVTANNLYAYLYGNFALPVAERTVPNTPHVTVQTIQSDSNVTPGAVVRLLVVLEPGADTHLYAPGAEAFQYHVVALHIDPSQLYRLTPVTYPKGKPLTFPELKQTVPVYTGKTVLSASIATEVTGATIPVFAKNPKLDVKGTLAYQACTATVCFPPVEAPVEWQLTMRALDRDRAPQALQRQ